MFSLQDNTVWNALLPLHSDITQRFCAIRKSLRKDVIKHFLLDIDKLWTTFVMIVVISFLTPSVSQTHRMVYGQAFGWERWDRKRI